MKPNDTVTIYSDPITQKKSEGMARLIQKLSEDKMGRLERWQVKFLYDSFICERTIKISDFCNPDVVNAANAAYERYGELENGNRVKATVVSLDVYNQILNRSV